MNTEKMPGRKRNRPIKDYSGVRFSRLVAVSLVERSPDNNHVWLFLCDCGVQKTAKIRSVRSGHTTSCGCAFREMMAARNTKHGMSAAQRGTYRSWKDMRSRCYNDKNKDYKDYGGRGIKVCERWNDFSAFFADLGERPRGKTIDRIDVNGDYTPDNCRWATGKQQANNRRSNRLIEFNGEKKTLQQWSEIYGIDRTKLSYRIKAGWSIDRCFSLEDGRKDGKNANHRNA